MKKKLSFFLIILTFILINVVFNFSLWKELFSNKMMVSDNVITEYLVETSYQNILHFKNPFITKTILYPFTTNFSLNDPNTAYVLPFFILRPFFDPHKSLLLITLASFFLNNFIMYLLFRKLKINQNISAIIALVFGFTPFLSQRLLGGHLAYIPIFFFPLTFILIDHLLKLKKKSSKIYISCLFGLLMAIILLSNFYYFFMIILGFIFYAGYWLFTDKKQFLKMLTENAVFLFISILSVIFFLIPWIMAVYDLIKTKGLTKTPGFGGAITLSADVLSFFTPSEYNPLYRKIFSFLSFHIPYFPKYNHFFLNSWDKFVYPGLLVIFTYLSIFFLKWRKKFPTVLWNKIKPHFLVSLFFVVLLLGPFLKVFNRWLIDLDGIVLVIPLPFLILHYLPGLSTLRASSRFAPAFVFLSLIVVAYVLNFVFEKIDKKKQIIIMALLAAIFLFDQFYLIPLKSSETIPVNIYSYLKNKDKGVVLEIPFTVRDGFKYFGFVHAIQPMAGQLIHGKPIIGGYIARVPNKVFNYYQNLKFIGYLGKIIDKGNYDPLKEAPKELVIFKYPYPLDTAKKELMSLNIRYIVLKQDEKYSLLIYNMLISLGFRDSLKDGKYELYEL
jgi:hypothetical protein